MRPRSCPDPATRPLVIEKGKTRVAFRLDDPCPPMSLLRSAALSVYVPPYVLVRVEMVVRMAGSKIYVARRFGHHQ